MCCQLEDQYENDIDRLSSELNSCRSENTRLKERLDRSEAPDVTALTAETNARVAELAADRRRLLTTVEVLEADLKCLRGELRRAEARAKQRRSSVGEDLLAELQAIESSGSCSPAPAVTPPADSNISPSPQSSFGCESVACDTSPLSDSVLQPRHTIVADIRHSDFKKVLVIGDSHLRHSATLCKEKGAYVECHPGKKFLDIKNILLGYVGVSLAVIYVRVGCNDLRKGYRGGPGYNGGHGKRQFLDSMADLLYAARTSFPESKIILNSILIRRDLSYKALHNLNYQLDLMSNNFGVVFVEANTCVGRRDLIRDGVHFKRTGMARLGFLMVDTVAAMLATTSVPLCDQCEDVPNPPSFEGPVREDAPRDGCSEHTPSGVSNRSGN